MASVLDLGFLTYLSPVFVFLLIFAATFAALQKTKIFGGKSGIDSLIAFAVAMMFILTSNFVELISTITPLFILLILFVVFLVLIFMFVGISEASIVAAFQDKLVIYIVLVIMILISIAAVTQVYGDEIQQIKAGEDTTLEESSAMQAVGDALFHPRVLGFVFLLMVAAQAVRLIAGPIGK